MESHQFKPYFGLSLLKLALLLALSLVTLTALAASAKSIQMSILLPETDAGGIWARLVFKEAFKRLNTELEVVTIPESRSYSEVMAGHFDGELVRAEKYSLLHPDLLKIKIPSVTIRLLAYSTFPIQSWEDLRNKDIRIDYKIGNAAVEGALQKINASDRVSTIKEDLQGFKKLASGHTDVYIGYDASTFAILKTHPDLAKKIKYQKILESFDVYTYFHPKHRLLAAQLEKILKQMEREGEIEKARIEGEKKAEEILVIRPN